MGDPLDILEGFQMRGATVVIIATWGRAMRESGAISPGWFMPISITANSVSAGIRASVSGTPQWLL